jgi:hypothetical protein
MSFHKIPTQKAPAMKTTERMFKVVAGLALWLALVGCAGAQGQGRTSWKEEVLLHDGTRMIVQRSQSYGGRREPGQTSPLKEESISFRLPGSTRTLNWISEYTEDVGRANFNLVALHVKDATPYVVAIPNLCLSYSKWGRPNPPYVMFRHDGMRWERITMDALPIDFRDINMVVTPGMLDAKEMSKSELISATEVQKRNASFRLPDEFRGILREPLSRERCPLYSSGPKAPNPIKQ